MGKLVNDYRKYSFLALCCMFSIIMTAQEVTISNLSSIKPGTKINYVIDFSQSTIMGMTESDFSNYEKDWNKDKPSIVTKFQKGLNNKLNGVLKFGTYTDSSYTLKVTVNRITDVGNIYCDATLTNKKGEKLFHVKNINGGLEPPILPGTKLAKIKIWATLTGRTLGGIIKSEYLNQ